MGHGMKYIMGDGNVGNHGIWEGGKPWNMGMT